MLFNSYFFIFAFLPLVWFGYYCFLRVSHSASMKIFLILSSLFFYGYWNIAYIPLLLGSILSNFLLASKISLGGGAKKALAYSWNHLQSLPTWIF